MEIWESTLRKLKKCPNVQIHNVLKVSYDGLDCVEKDIFLDIAFFFKGECRDDVIKLLNAFDFYAESGIDSLLDKTLITLSTSNKIQMHDLIQEMGEQIVREESIKDPGKRSRLSDREEVYDVLKNNKGTDGVEGIILDVSQIRHVQLKADTFKKMTNLRFLKFYSHGWNRASYNVNLPSGLESFSDKLRYFQWDGYPLESLPSTFHAEKLVKLHMQNSHVTKLWDGVQDLVNLSEINLRASKQLIELPDFSKAQNLQLVNFSCCRSLCNVHPSILSLHSLVTLNLRQCTELKSLKSETHLKSLRDLIIYGCSSLKEFSLSSEEMTELFLGQPVSIEILYSSIGRLSKLNQLIINGETPKNLPIEIYRLRSLKRLELRNYGQVEKWELHILFDALHSLEEQYLDECSKLSELPENINALSSLKILCLNGSSVESLPASIKHLSSLEAIGLNNCCNLWSLPKLPLSIKYFTACNCKPLECFSFNQLIFEKYIYEVCYPGSRVPEWFRYKRTIETLITIDVDPPFDHLGFIFCVVVPQLTFKETVEWVIYSECYFEDGEKVKGESYSGYPTTELKLDHVFLWKTYPFFSENILEGVRKRRGNDEGSTYNTKLSFQFSICSYGYNGVSTGFKYDGLIKACGVYPIYADSKLELGTKTKRRRDIDEQQQLPSTKKLKESCFFHPLQLKFARKMKGFLSLAN